MTAECARRRTISLRGYLRARSLLALRDTAVCANDNNIIYWPASVLVVSASSSFYWEFSDKSVWGRTRLSEKVVGKKSIGGSAGRVCTLIRYNGDDGLVRMEGDIGCTSLGDGARSFIK